MTSSRTDAEIITYSYDDPRSFGEIFDRHVGVIHAFVVRRIGPEGAEDVTSEVFCTAFRKRHRYDSTRPDARPWLYGIAGNLVRRKIRSEGRRLLAYQRVLGDRALHPDEIADIDNRLEAEQMMHIFQAALARLGEKERSALLLHCWEELTYQEVALALGVPIGTVRSRISRARHRLRSELWPVEALEPWSEGKKGATR